MSLAHNLNRARNIFLTAARLNKHCHPAKFALAVEMADAIENAIETLDQQEIEMSAAAEAIRYERSEKEKAQAQAADLKTQLEAANAAPKLDADDQAEIKKTQDEQNPPPSVAESPAQA